MAAPVPVEAVAEAAPIEPQDGAVGIRIRMFRVGFGDFFLLSIPSGEKMLHILVDCGVHAHDIQAMTPALEQLKDDTGGQLALVIMTHRHADHISGFATGKAIFADFRVEQVWMSWFEDPKDGAAVQVQNQLVAMAQQLHTALRARARPEDEQYQNMAANILGLGPGSSNDVALEVLRSFKTAGGKPTPIGYFRAGDAAILPPSLVAAGLTADILGPPTDLALVAQMDNHSHQYLTDGNPETASPLAPFDPVYSLQDYKWPQKVGAPRWLQPLYSVADIEQHIQSSQPDVLAAAAQSADNAINNQSVVVLFRFRGKSLLFCGDAQWGNWANFLFGGPVGSSGQATLTPQSSGILSTLDFLKVGHHGSTNATPIDVVNALRKGCVAMCSTDPGAYGKESSGTEVPRIPLLKALQARTDNQLARSDQIGAGTASPTVGLDPLAEVFRAGPDGPNKQQYIDYTL